MRAVTLWQPWASQVFDILDPKDVENRRTLRPPEELVTNLWSPPRPPRDGVLRVDTGRHPFFAVHAGKVYDDGPALAAAGRDTAGRLAFPAGVRVPPREALPYGAVVGVARVLHAFDSRTRTTVGVSNPPAGILECQALPLARWWLGPIGWRLVHAIPLAEPVPCKGALGVWTLPDDVALQVARRALRAVNAELEGRAYAGAPGAPAHHRDAEPADARHRPRARERGPL